MPGRTSAWWFPPVPAKAEAHERTHAHVRQRREDPSLQLCAFTPRRRVRRGSCVDPGRAAHKPWPSLEGQNAGAVGRLCHCGGWEGAGEGPVKQCLEPSPSPWAGVRKVAWLLKVIWAESRCICSGVTITRSSRTACQWRPRPSEASAGYAAFVFVCLCLRK